MFAALGELYTGGADTRRVLEIPPRGLLEGMILAEDLTTRNGMLLVPRGCAVTATIIERVRNYKPGTLKDTVRISTGPAAG